MPGESGEPVVTNSYAFYFACEAAGASSTRHSPRPLNVQKALQDAKLARGVRRDRGGVCVSSRGKKGKLCVWKCTGRVAYSATASPVLSLPLLWGGWREAPGGANSRITKQPPPVTSLAPLTMCHPRASFARLDPTKGRDKKERASLDTREKRGGAPATSFETALRAPQDEAHRPSMWLSLTVRRSCGNVARLERSNPIRWQHSPRYTNRD